MVVVLQLFDLQGKAQLYPEELGTVVKVYLKKFITYLGKKERGNW